MLPTITRALDVEMIRDGGSYAATFGDEDDCRYILFIRIKHVDRGEGTSERIGYEAPVLIDCDPTKRSPNTDEGVYSELSGPAVALTWTEARTMMALTKGLAEGLDKWRREWLDQMNHVVNSGGGLPPDSEAIVRVRRMAKEQFSDETGDAGDIDRLLGSHLQRIETDASGWRTTYRDTQTGQLWELTYSRSEMHGGGPRLLKKIQQTAR